MAKTIEFHLTEPLETSKGTITALTVRRPKAGDLEGIEAARGTSDMAASFAMVQALTGLSAEEVRDIDATDFMNLAEKMGEFFPKPPAA